MAILRVAKIKTMSSLAARGKHNFRERETPNANAERTPLNQIAGAQTTDELMQRVSDLLPTKRRKDAVIGLEYLITASPEHFGQDWQSRGDEGAGAEYFRDAIAWLEKRHGKGNVVCATVHLDESTPHLAAFVVPRTADGRLAAKDFVGGAAKLSKMQTEFADQVGAKHGLERGVEWSKAVHKPNAAIAPMTAERLALRKSVKDLEAEVERLTQQVTTGGGALAKAVKKAEKQQQLNVEFIAIEQRLTAELAAAKATEQALRDQLNQALLDGADAIRAAKLSAGQVAVLVEELSKQGAALVAAQEDRAEVGRQLVAAQNALQAASRPTAVAAAPLGKAWIEKAPEAREMPLAGDEREAAIVAAQKAAIRAEEKRLGVKFDRHDPRAGAIRVAVREKWNEAEAARLAPPEPQPPKQLEREKPKARSVALPPKGRSANTR